jgi:hypothetical protein
MQPKSPEDVTDEEIKGAALTFARMQGIEASEEECFLSPTTRRVIIDETTGELRVDPPTIWEVRIFPQTQTEATSRGIAVQVIYQPTGVVGTEFWELP